MFQSDSNRKSLKHLYATTTHKYSTLCPTNATQSHNVKPNEQTSILLNISET